MGVFRGPISIIKYILYNFGDIWSSNPRDCDGNNYTFVDETAKIGISDRISQQLLDDLRQTSKSIITFTRISSLLLLCCYVRPSVGGVERM